MGVKKMLAAKLYNNKDTESYMKTQFKSFKKHQELLTSEDILNDIKSDVSIKYNVIFTNTNGFVIKFDKKNNPDTIIDDIQSIMGSYYGELDTTLLYKFFVIENELVVQKKR